MMFEGKHIHFSPVNQKPLCSYSAKICKQRRINGYAFCIRHILEDKSAPFRQCAYVARYNKQKCTNPIPTNQNRDFCNSHLQVLGMLPKKERKIKREKDNLLGDGKLKFADRLKALLMKENNISRTEHMFGSDDPYAFQDSLSENGLVVMPSPQIGKNAWNCSQKNSLEIPITESLLVLELSPESLPPDSNKPKGSILTTPQTMNRLHAKIAQNKLIDKLKRTQVPSQTPNTKPCALMRHIADVKTEPASPSDLRSVNCETGEAKSLPEFPKIFKIDAAEGDTSVSYNWISPSDPSPVSQADSINSCSSPVEKYGSSTSPKIEDFDRTMQTKNATANYKVPFVLRKLRRILYSNKKTGSYIFPRGIDSSDSDSSDNEESPLFSRLLARNVWDSSSPSSLPSAELQSRTEKHAQVKADLIKSFCHLSDLWKLQKPVRENNLNNARRIIEAARAYPNHVADILSSNNNDKTSILQGKEKKFATTLKTTCCFKQDDVSCNQIALPYTWHCQKHITYNVSQLLFEHCTAKFADNTQCCVPVFDICHELPLCFEHAKKRDDYNKMASEPKPKKPRKKPKPSALTRPPKRGKKKKKPNSVTLALIPSSIESESSIQIDLPNSSISKSMENVLLPVMNKVLNGEMHHDLESDLEDFSPGAIEKTFELPLDTADLASHASKLLDEHDFTDVLKIPDDAFNDLFVDIRNGEFMPTQEESEELERALAAASKDVHVAQESLAKFSGSSGSGPDLDELERALEMHSNLLSAGNLTSAIDEHSFGELSSNQFDSLNAISSSLTTSDLNSLTQALSAISQPESLESSSNSAITSTASLSTQPQMLNGHSELLHQYQLDPAYLSNFLSTSSGVLNTCGGSVNSIITQSAQSENKLLTNGSTMYYTVGSTSSTPISAPQILTTEEPRGSSNHWLLNSDTFALPQLTVGPNGFLVASQTSGPFSNNGNNSLKFGDVHDIPLVPVTKLNDQTHGIGITNGPAPTNAVKVMVQEGAS